MEIVISRHAKRRMKWRRISLVDVEFVLKKPDRQARYRLDQVIINATRMVKGKTLVVGYKIENDQMMVITVIDKSQ